MSSLRVERTGHAVVQDLGRPGYAGIGIPANGASDHHSARTSNILVGNADTAPVIEVTGSELTFVAESNLLLAVTGAAEQVLVDGFAQPACETLTVFRGATVSVPVGRVGLRSYVGINGLIETPRALGSVAPDRLMGVGRRLATGERLSIESRYDERLLVQRVQVFRLGASRQQLSSLARVDATLGPDIERMKLGPGCLSAPYEVSTHSDHIGLRLLGPLIEQTSTAEILSRGVPTGAIEVPPAGGIIMLLRGRLVTAGYPVIGVVTSESLDRLGQVRPGDSVAVTFCSVESALAKLRKRDAERHALALRVQAAFGSSGLGALIDPAHGSSSRPFASTR